MVKSYIRRKKKIVIHLHGLSVIEHQLAAFVFEDKVKEEETTGSDWDPNKDLSRINLLSPKIFTYLPNVTDIMIRTTPGYDTF